jgi:hypothetical protein
MSATCRSKAAESGGNAGVAGLSQEPGSSCRGSLSRANPSKRKPPVEPAVSRDCHEYKAMLSRTSLMRNKYSRRASGRVD